MTESTLNNRRRLERHSRRDGDLQSRARPVSMVRNAVEEDRSSVAFIRDFVENAHQAGLEMTKRLLPLSDSESGDGGDESTSSTRTGSGTSTGENSESSSSSSSSSSVGRPGGFDTSSTSTRRTSTLDESSTSTSSSSTLSTRTSTTPTSTRSSTSTTPTSTRMTSSSSSAILTTTAAAPTSTQGPSTSVAFVTASSATQSANVAAASSTESSSSSGVGAGPIIGIVAGSLAGIAVIAVIVGFLFKKFGRKEDPYEADPFDRDDFRRQSAMLPEAFDSEDGHPSMSEHNNLHNSMGPFSDNGYAGAGAGAAAGMGGMAAASSFTSHNESGGPRPPTMFQKHINGPGAQYSVHDGRPAPQVGAIFNPAELTPQLPPMAFGGSDPYSIAGVGRNHQLDGNLNNPYAHLDRSMSNNNNNNVRQNTVQQPAQEQYEGQGAYGNLDRNGSQGSYSNEQYQSGESAAHGYNTTGRPGTAEGRSGTPDLPNVQQTYALGDGSENEHAEMDRVASPHRMVASPQHLSQDMYAQYQQYQQGPFDGGSPPQQPLQVRNLLPNPHEAQRYAQRPISTASSQPADDDAAYGGVW